MPDLDYFLRMPEVEQMVGLKRVAIYGRIAAGTFPRQIRLSRTVAVWSQREIQAWMEEQVKARDAVQEQTP